MSKPLNQIESDALDLPAAELAAGAGAKRDCGSRKHGESESRTRHGGSPAARVHLRKDVPTACSAVKLLRERAEPEPAPRC